jgi:hypothetical protein
LRTLVKPASNVAMAFSSPWRSVASAPREKYTRRSRRVFRTIGQVRMHVDEAGQAGVVQQVEHRHARCRGAAASGTRCDAHDAPIADHHHHLAMGDVAETVDELAALNRDAAAVRGERHLAHGELLAQFGRWNRASESAAQAMTTRVANLMRAV